MHIVHSIDCLLHKIGRAPAPWLQISQNMHIADMNTTQRTKIGVNLSPWTTRLVSSERLTVILMHSIEVLIEWQGGIHHHLTVSVMRTHQHRRLVGASQRFQSILNTGNDSLRKPFHIILIRIHCLAQAYKKSYIRIFFNEGSNRLTGVVTHQRSNGTVTVLGLQPIMIRKRLTEKNIIEHLNNKNTAFLRFSSEEQKHVLIHLERFIIHFHCKRIVFQTDQRCKRMSVPQIKRVHPVLHQHVQIIYPLCLIIKPRKILRRIRILVYTTSGQILHLLYTYTATPKNHLGRICKGSRQIETALIGLQPVYDFTTPIDNSRSIVTHHTNQVPVRGNGKAFFFQACRIRCLKQTDADALVLPDNLRALQGISNNNRIIAKPGQCIF